MSGGRAMVGLLVSLLGGIAVTAAQSPQGVEHACAGATSIGVVAGLRGREKAAGEAWLQGIRAGLRGVPCVDVDVADASQEWGQTTSKVVQLAFADHALALLAPDGETTHLCELIAAKLGVPVVSTASDNTTTSAHLSWIFRVAPSDRQQAQLLAHAVYRTGGRSAARVLLVTANDHDGREGELAFLAAAKALGVSAPKVLLASEDAAVDALQGVHVVVFWTGPAETESMLRRWSQSNRAEVLLSWRSAGLFAPMSDGGAQVVGQSELAGVQPCRVNSLRPHKPVLWQEADAAGLLLAREIRASRNRRRRLRNGLHAIRRGRLRLFDGNGSSRSCFRLAPLAPLRPEEREGKR